MPHALPRKLFAFAATTPFALGLAIAVGPTSTAEAGSSDYSCPSGQTMQRSGSGVYCLKKGSVRSNRPTCGIRRYKTDASGTTDWCTTTSGKKTGLPTCKTGGKRRSVRGADQCVNPDTKSSVKRCPSGYSLKGSTSSLGGRGSVHCYKPGTVTVRRNKPTCGIRRYKIDGSGTTDWCTDTRGRRTGYPTCKTGGKKRSVSGADQCIDESPGKTTRPS